MKMDEFIIRLRKFGPDYIFIETKTPLMDFIKEFISGTREIFSGSKFILVGDHATYQPEESLLYTKSDYLIAGGDYDFYGNELLKSIEKNKILPQGCYKRIGETVKSGGHFKLLDDLDKIPMIDRELTNYSLYEEAYLYHPCAYILSGRGCGARIGKVGLCTFCIWQHTLWDRTARLHSPQRVAEEIELLVKKYKVKEIFDDNESGALWDHSWLEKLYRELEKKKLVGKFYLSSNARIDALDEKTCSLAKKIGYRLLKVGMETGTDKFLKFIGKNETVALIRRNIKTAKDNGLIIMLTIMTGYPKETLDDVKKTYKLARELMLYKTHFGDCLQASVLTPYPGAPLFDYALKNNSFIELPKKYDDYDMSRSILRSEIDANYWCNKLWKIHNHPLFLLRSFLTLRHWQEIKAALNGIRSLFGHLKDFSSK
jgi:radical SAM superfamily enzyme YgiQ (UPF0313 family)